jgi:methylated-DNA-[protein]-cysteine S-methyltransferase
MAWALSAWFFINSVRFSKGGFMSTYLLWPSRLGQMRLAAEQQMSGSWVCTGIHFEGQKYYPEQSQSALASGDSLNFLETVADALKNYYAGHGLSFTFALAPSGTDFQKKVWQELLNVGFGQTISYGELARRLQHPAAVRAAAAAVGKNPISVLIPCHRIVGANGSLTGYAGGLDRKAKLLELESQQSSLL